MSNAIFCNQQPASCASSDTWYILVVLLFYVNIWICLVHFTYTRILPLSVRAKIFFVLHYLTHEFKKKIEVLFREYLYRYVVEMEYFIDIGFLRNDLVWNSCDKYFHWINAIKLRTSRKNIFKFRVFCKWIRHFITKLENSESGTNSLKLETSEMLMVSRWWLDMLTERLLLSDM